MSESPLWDRIHRQGQQRPEGSGHREAEDGDSLPLELPPSSSCETSTILWMKIELQQVQNTGCHARTCPLLSPAGSCMLRELCIACSWCSMPGWASSSPTIPAWGSGLCCCHSHSTDPHLHPPPSLPLCQGLLLLMTLLISLLILYFINL